MSTPKQNIKLFHNLVDDFLEYLYHVVPSKDDKIQLKTYINGLKLLRGFNDRLLVTHFVNYAMPYVEYIGNRDETYFLSEDIDAFAFIKDSENVDEAKEQGLRLKDLWKDETIMTQEVKDHIWHYIQQLLLLGFKINGMVQ